MEWLLLSLVFIAFVILTALRGSRKTSDVRGLLREGASVQGVVLSKQSLSGGSPTSRWLLVYEYTVEGRKRTGRSLVSDAQARSVAVGQPIALKYLPSNPRISAPELLIDADSAGDSKGAF